MSIQSDLDALVAAATAIRDKLSAVFADDRRDVLNRPNGKAKGKARHCPIPGCVNGWTAANGGICRDHLNTKRYKDWKAARTAKGGKKAAKKR